LIETTKHIGLEKYRKNRVDGSLKKVSLNIQISWLEVLDSEEFNNLLLNAILIQPNKICSEVKSKIQAGNKLLQTDKKL